MSSVAHSSKLCPPRCFQDQTTLSSESIRGIIVESENIKIPVTEAFWGKPSHGVIRKKKVQTPLKSLELWFYKEFLDFAANRKSSFSFKKRANASGLTLGTPSTAWPKRRKIENQRKTYCLHIPKASRRVLPNNRLDTLDCLNLLFC